MNGRSSDATQKMTYTSTTNYYRRSGFPAILLAGLGLVLVAQTVCGQETAQYFRQNCASCHTIGGGRLTGPDLKDVTKRKERDWLVKFIQNPTAVLNSGDAYALKLKEEARGAVMVTIPGMTRDRADALLQLIDAESALEESQFKGIVVSTEPYTEQEIEQGRRYVLGTARLANGGAACISCHSVRGTGPLGGGRLGPDLTRVYQRLGGDSPRKNLTAWLTAPATATMAPVFRKHPLTKEEVHGLVAFFEHSAQAGGESDAGGSLAYLLLGVIVAVCGLAGMDAIWRHRFRSVRRALVWSSRKSACTG
ncbi:MAG: cytochrome c [Rhodopirellula sp.]|nr:cytochrome c [Rhodopirellula sp.]